MTLAPRTEITQAAIARLVPALWGKPRIAAILQSWVDEVQELELAIFASIDARLLDNAAGVRLRVLARLVGQRDFGWSDDDLRAAVRARIRANRSDGLSSDVRDVAALLAPGSTFKVLDGAGPLTMVLRWTSAVGLDWRALLDILSDTRPGGVRLTVTRPLTAHTLTFNATDPAEWWGADWADILET